jgi:hypothetical protein
VNLLKKNAVYAKDHAPKNAQKKVRHSSKHAIDTCMNSKRFGYIKRSNNFAKHENTFGKKRAASSGPRVVPALHFTTNLVSSTKGHIGQSYHTPVSVGPYLLT